MQVFVFVDFIKSILCFVGNIINKKGAAKKATPNEQLIWVNYPETKDFGASWADQSSHQSYLHTL